MGGIRIAERSRAALRAALALLLAVAVVVAIPSPARADTPVVSPAVDQVLTEGDSLTVIPLATWTDGAGANPAYSATVDFGLGAGDEACDGGPCTLTVDGGGASGSVTGTATYPDDDLTNVTIKVTDGSAAEGSGSFQVTVNNADPVLAVRDSLSVPEGTTVNLGGGTGTTYTDPGVLDTHTATADWDEGAPPADVTAVAGVVTGSNLYDDDGTYNVDVVLTDDDLGSDTGQFTVTVTNVAPVLSVRTGATVPEGTTVNLSGGGGTTFTDVGTADTHTATVDWGDGTPVQTAAVGAGVINASHEYDDDTGGPFTVTVTVQDDDGGSDSEQFTVTVNNVNPTLDVRNNVTVPEGTTVNLNGGDGTTFTDPGSGDTHSATVDWDEGAGPVIATVGAGVLTGSNLYEDQAGSPFTVDVVITDDDTGSDNGSFTVTVNNAAPVLTVRGDATIERGTNIGLAGDGGTSFTDAGVLDTHAATVDWDDGGGVEIAGVNQGAGSGTITGNHTYTSNGIYTVSVEVDDGEGGSDADTFTVTVSNSPFTVNAGSNETIDEGDTVAVNATFNDTDGAGTHTATINWGDGNTDNCATAACTIVDNGNGTGTVTGSHVYPDDNPTAYTVTVTVQDETADLAADSFNVTVNDVAPTLTLSGNASVNEGSGYTLTIGAITDPGADTVTDWIVDWGDGTAPQTFGTGGDRTHVYADGLDNVTISIDLIDEEDRYTNVDTLDVTVDNVAPTIALSGAGTVDEGSTFTLTIGALTDPGADTATGYTIDWGDGTAPEPVAAAPGGFTHTYADGNGSPTIEVSVDDDDGTFLAGTLGITVNNIAPTVSAPATATITEGGTLGTSISFADPALTNDTYEARIDYGEGGGFGSWMAASSPFNLSNLYEDDGSYTVTIEVRDEDGGTGSDTINVTVTNAAPVVTARNDVMIPEGTTVFVGNGTGTSFSDAGVEDTHTATIDWDEGAGFETATVDETNGSGTVGFPGGHTYDVPGVYTVTVAVVDAAEPGSFGTDSFTVNVQNLNLAVNATPDGASTIDEGDTVSLTATFSDSDGTGSYSATIDWGDGTIDDCSTAACSLTGGGGGSGNVSGTHTYPQDGSFTVTVTVDDGGIDIGANGFTYTVQNVLPTTNITGPVTSDEGTRFRLLGNPSDPGADPLTYEWTITKNGEFFQSGIFKNISVRPDDNGTYEAQFVVFDDDGQSTETFTWTVLNISPRAEIIDADTGDPVAGIAEIGEEGSTITLGADVEDPSPVDTFSYEWTISQPGSDPVVGTNPTISFVSPDDGLFFVSLTVSDDDGGSFTPSAPIISVLNADPVVDNVVTDPTPAVGATVSLGVFFSDPGSLDTHSMTVDWGDGDTETVASASSPETFTHSYPTAGPRLAEVCIDDDDGGRTCAVWWYNVGGSLSTDVDYNGDGRGDLAVGVPGEDDGAGAVHVLYGKAIGLSGDNDQFLRQGIGGVKGSQQVGDAFGSALAHGDFDGDGYTDIAIGAPGDEQSGANDAGNVTVIYGSSSGLDLATDQVWHEDRNSVPDSAEAGDGFGESLVAGDFNGDAYADLAIGVPFEDVGGKADTGRVIVMFGSPSGLSGSGSQVLDQNIGNIKNSNAPDDHYGAALSAGDFNGDGFVDLAVGVPGQKLNGVLRVGAVNVLFGTPIGLAESGDVVFQEGSNGIAGNPAKLDGYGSSLAVGDSNDDGYDDLLIGIPNQKVNGERQAGTAAYIPGSPTLDGAGDSRWHEDRNTVLGVAERADHLGAAVAIVDVNGNGRGDLILGIPDQNSDTARKDVGAVLLIRGGKNKPVTKKNQYLWQGVDGLSDGQQKFDRFGAAF